MIAVMDRVRRALVLDELAVAPLDLLVLGPAHVEDVAPARAAVDEPTAEPDTDRVLSATAVDRVAAVARVDPVVPGTGVHAVLLALGVAGGLVVGPDHVVTVPAVD